MLRGRPGLRLELLLQGAAFVALLAVFLLLLVQLREEPARRPAPEEASRPPAPVSSLAPAPLVVLAPPSPSPPSRPKEEATSDANVPPPSPPAPAAPTSVPPPEKLVRPHLVFKDARGANAVNVLVNAQTRTRKLRPARTTSKGDVLLDEVAPSDGPLRVTVRDAVYGKQRFSVEISEKPEKLVLETPRRGRLAGTIATTEGVSPHEAVLTLVDQDGITSEPAVFWDGSHDSVEVVPGTYRVRAGAAGYCPSDWTKTSVRLYATTEVNLTVLRASTISGTIALDEPPATVGRIEIELEAQTPEGLRTETRPVKLDATFAAYKLEPVRPGWYRARALSQRHDGSWGTVQVVEGEPTFNFTLFLDGDRHDPAVEGSVRDPSGLPVPAAIVRASGHETVTDDTGRFLLRLDANAGSVELFVEKEGYEAEKKRVSIRAGERTAKGIFVQLEPLE